MKSERGVTLTAIMIYIIALTIAVLLIGRITTYFYKNVSQISKESVANTEYTKFNSYFTDEINIEGNEVELCDKEYIVFSKTQNQYTFKKNAIYVNKTKLAKNIEFCEFYYNEETKQIDVNLKIQGKYYSTTFTVVK